MDFDPNHDATATRFRRGGCGFEDRLRLMRRDSTVFAESGGFCARLTVRNVAHADEATMNE